MGIDETGRDNETSRVDNSFAGPGFQVSNFLNYAVGNADVRPAAACSRTIDNCAALNE